MNLTLQVLSTIFPSGMNEHSEHIPSDLNQLESHRYSVKNRISLLYLEALNKNQRLGTLKPVYEKENSAYVKTLDLIAECSQSLSEANIDHAVFKTLRPYRSTTVDIDILVFGDENHYLKASMAMQQAGFKFVVRGPRSTTLMDPNLHIGIDLYEEIAVSSTIYVDKEKLTKFVCTTELPTQKRVKTLTPEADLATILAHSLIKEQMYPLSEYCTFIHYLGKLKIDNFIQMIEQNNLKIPARTHVTLTALIYEALNGKIHGDLQQILGHLGDYGPERKLFIQANLKTPYKYSLFTVTRALFEVMRAPKCRTSLATQILRSLDPSFAKDFMGKLTDHIVRETY